MPSSSYSMRCADDDWWDKRSIETLKQCLPGAEIISEGYPRSVVVVNGDFSHRDIALALVAAMGEKSGVRVTARNPRDDASASSVVRDRVARLFPGGRRKD